MDVGWMNRDSKPAMTTRCDEEKDRSVHGSENEGREACGSDVKGARVTLRVMLTSEVRQVLQNL